MYFFFAKTSELSGAGPLCLFDICCSERQNVFEAAPGWWFVVLRIDLLEEEKGAEAVFSLSITSYSYVYCVQTAEQAMAQWCSILLAAYGIAEFLVQKIEPFLPDFSSCWFFAVFHAATLS